MEKTNLTEIINLAKASVDESQAGPMVVYIDGNPLNQDPKNKTINNIAMGVFSSVLNHLLAYRLQTMKLSDYVKKDELAGFIKDVTNQVIEERLRNQE